ncbi:MAG: metal ABC transporter permease [Pseudomonadota bacterium]
MLDDFFTRAVVAGLGVAVVAGPLGCFIVWRRLAYFGDTLSHAALLGIALALLLDLSIFFAVFAVCVLVSVALLGLRRQQTLSSDALLGLLAHGALAIGLVALSFLTFLRVDLMGFLFGDILAVSANDIAVIYAGGAFVAVLLAVLWRPLFAATVDRDMAAAEGMKPEALDFALMVMLATVIAIAMKIVGALLITALLLIPATAARQLSRGPETMALMAAVLGALSVIAGLQVSLALDTPAGPSIVMAAVGFFLFSMLPITKFLRQQRKG